VLGMTIENPSRAGVGRTRSGRRYR